MKIAILLRGQLRNVETGIYILNKILSEKYPQHEFRIFLHGWNTRPQKNVYKIKVNNSWRMEEISKTELDQYVKIINPDAYELSQSRELSDFIKHDILDETYKDIAFIDWFKSLSLEETVEQVKFFYIPTQTKEEFELRLVEANFLLGQHYSAAKSHEVYYQYKNKTGWVADLVWMTRIDSTLNIDDSYWDNWFENTLNTINGYLKYEYTQNPIMTTELSSKGNIPFLCDINFIMRDQDAKLFFGTNAKKRFKEIFIKDKLKMMPFLMNTKGFAHTFWTQLGSKVNFFEGDFPKETLIRKNFVLDKNFNNDVSLRDLYLMCRETCYNAHNKYNNSTIEDTKKFII